MNYRDIEMLNQSMSGLGDTLLRNRMMAEQKADKAQAEAERAQDRGDRLAAQKAQRDYQNAEMQRQLTNDKINQELNKANLELSKKSNSRADDQLAFNKQQAFERGQEILNAQARKDLEEMSKAAHDATNESIKNSLGLMKEIGRLVAAGSWTDEQASKFWKDHISKADPTVQKAMSADPVNQILISGQAKWGQMYTEKQSEEKDVVTETTGEIPDPKDPSKTIPYSSTKRIYKVPPGTYAPTAAAAKPSDSAEVDLSRFSVMPLGQNPNLDVTKKFPGSP
jgi:hypothetical protein